MKLRLFAIKLAFTGMVMVSAMMINAKDRIMKEGIKDKTGIRQIQPDDLNEVQDPFVFSSRSALVQSNLSRQADSASLSPPEMLELIGIISQGYQHWAIIHDKEAGKVNIVSQGDYVFHRAFQVMMIDGQSLKLHRCESDCLNNQQSQEIYMTLERKS
ncbi:MAG: hypothetical protein ACO2ZM_02825 [Francisellaceae bacterium]